MIKKLKGLLKQYLNDKDKVKFEGLGSKSISYEDYKYLLNRADTKRNF